MVMDPQLELACRLDPAVLMDAVGLEPDPWQARALRSTADRMLLLCARQLGKSRVTSLIALHQALFTPDSTTLLLAPSLRQSQELFAKVMWGYGKLDRPVPAARELALSLELVNGSRIITLPGDEGTVRGFSAVNLVIIDEAARVSDALLPGVAPMLAISRGRLLLLSTPFGRRGVFFDTWESGDPTWERIQVRADECPRIDPAFLAEQRRLLGPRWFAQEYESQFVEADDQVFSAESIAAVFREADNTAILQGF
jgi:hypothetical protein